MNKQITTAYFRQAKKEGQPITMLTAYDYAMARLTDAAGIDAILVGDSLGNVMLGYDSTIPVTMDDMIHHLKAVCRGVNRAMVIGDLPFLSYHLSFEQSIKNAGRILQEGGAQAVKLEGGQEVVPVVQAFTAAGIPVMGHLGLTPQSIYQLGGYKVQGKEEAAARKLVCDAHALQKAGVFALVLECIPAMLARYLTEKLTIPTIGIGAGADCDGQILVIHDLLGLLEGQAPKFVKQYAKLREEIIQAIQTYRVEVQNRIFPGPEQSYPMAKEVLDKIGAEEFL
ncbi:3-methyl-2-oxobutanoate hydroxymethyltransferase [Peptococcaceae bacterium SCADC1_2_3]|nr:3-methyl-2-oxobutanoate hydroxymethyltransferase [Peptococcaceae bacterium SCADC1_2_3]KFI36272.1 3-methyl-2-oxobutanoate hydroxymethyltransferase [Peptococcaceae bacterium SCADC1_2_3]KFI37611.1 3-methyl-2-oxobutanoate hydroxymethyltransferase [Peptococcaceae bacterium SCADC1_2_3]HBQ27817.1 3-methyl-2-oxobutanoate hydroxymethyltransferase [Desulfotomaculum sp.]